MDALKMAAVEPSQSAHECATTSVLEKSGIKYTPRMKTAIAALLEAIDYARDLGASPWDFAIEISSMRRFKLSNSDLRWLVVRGFVDHAIEITLGGDSQRSFRHPARLLFCKRICFVLTEAGIALAKELCDRSDRRPRGDGCANSETPALAVVGSQTRLAPKWDRDRHELSVGQTLVKQFKIPAGCQEAILAAFEEKNWPERIEDPLAARPASSLSICLASSIALLNKNQKRSLICFREDADGRGVLWELCADQAASHEA